LEGRIGSLLGLPPQWVPFPLNWHWSYPSTKVQLLELSIASLIRPCFNSVSQLANANLYCQCYLSALKLFNTC
jgi:hypothetical protein